MEKECGANQNCKNPAVPGRKLCEAHAERRRFCRRRLDAGRKASVAAQNVLLEACGDTPAEPAKETPKRARPDYKRIRIEKRKALGLCIREEKNQERRETRARRTSRVRNAAKVLLEQHPDILDASPEALRLMRMKIEGDEDNA
ncbi:hypothetical protein EKO27_g9210 [Xylaria grammica]|uniref:Uncharacterized protein n=1 Tax=Xylaria grammica TaxID=363999 RepID=A0A439CUP9_9PEZI|nr:hypothetical protein EKO27_g9210 [Xylaria grammica]